MINLRSGFLNLILVAAASFSLASVSMNVNAATKEDLNDEAATALQTLYKTNPVAADISRQAKAVLVFPKIIKAGLVFGGSYGEGVLTKGSHVARSEERRV